MPNPGRILYPADETQLQIAKPISFPQTSSPIERLKDELVLTQRFKIWGNSFSPLERSTLYTSEDNFPGASNWTNFAGFVLVAEGDRSDSGGGFVEWERTFAKVPTRHVDPVTFDYDFIAFYPGVLTVENGIPDNGRASFRASVSGVMVFDYALIDDINDLNSLLPIIPAQEYALKKTGGATPPAIGSIYPFSDQEQIWASGRVANVDTSPTLEEYKAWIEGTANPAIDALSLGIGDTSLDDYQNYIVGQDSQIETWRGKIMCRKTILIKPQ